MFQFNSDNILTGFIKELLKDNYIPTLPIWNKNKKLIKNQYYIYNSNIIKATENYNPKEIEYIENRDSINWTSYFKIIKPYFRNEKMNNFNSNYISYISGYDSETHKHLGDYLRMLRDFDGIDLMQYYNCFNNIYSDNLRIKQNSETTIIDYNKSINDDNIVTLVPIKFDQDYTIYINARNSIQIMPCLYDGINLIENIDINAKCENINYCSYNQPYHYKGIESSIIKPGIWDVETSNLNWERYLYLLIQMPKALNQNILILEGDYSNSKFVKESDFTIKLPKIIGSEYSRYTDNELNKFYNSVPGLTREWSLNSLPFSDRLIEYLLLNVIDKDDKISKDIERIQLYLSNYKSLELFGSKFNLNSYNKGIWDNNLRNHVYNVVTNYKTPQLIDINGYVDKDSEKIILGGKQ